MPHMLYYKGNMGKHNTIESLSRMLQVIKLMGRDKGATITQIAEATGIDRWTVRDMIDSLENLDTDGRGLRIEEYTDPDDNRKTCYHIAKDNLWTLTLPGLNLTDEEGMLLALLLNQSRQVPILRDVATGLENKINWLKDAAPYRIYNVNAIEKIVPPEALQAVNVILNAIREDKCVSFRYSNAGNSRNSIRRVVPMYMFVYDGGLYLVAQQLEDGSRRTFAAERIQGVPAVLEISSDDRPAKLEYDGSLEDPFGPFPYHEEFTAKVTFDSWQGWYNMQKRWPDKVSVSRNPDGTCTVSARTRNTFGVKKWIMSQGHAVRKVEPEWLRAEVAAELSDTLNALGNFTA